MNPPRRRTRDFRLRVAMASIVVMAITGYLISMAPGRGVAAVNSTPFDSLATVKASPIAASESKIRYPDEQVELLPAPAAKALIEAESHLSRGQYDAAVSILSAAQPYLKDDARAYEVIGRALEGKQDYVTARDFFTAAIDRDPLMADAYWGVATSSEALGDIEAALGAMRSYLHTEQDKDPERLRIAQARSALWEWEAQLGRGPWGPTKGIPPGFTADDIKRDGRGVATRTAIPGTEGPDGSAQAEIRHSEKQVIFSRP